MSIASTKSEPLRAPFPWFGGKRTVAATIWERLGDVVNYVEPFFGSGAVLLARPHAPHTETINDADHMVANFWRAVQADPEAVAHHADWPVNETDLGARHWWLLNQGKARLSAIEGDPDLYDAQVAGWWVWGACAWIAQGWCSGDGPWQWDGAKWVKSNGGDDLGNAGQGLNRQLPHLGNAGRGVNRKLPHLGDGTARRQFIAEWISALSERLRDVRVSAGDWSRVCGPSVTHRHGLTGVFLDPPYSDAADRDTQLYAVDSGTVAHEAREWAIAEGVNPLMRIAFAGYEGEHVFPKDWAVVEWKARGGFGSQGKGRGRENCNRERLWFSPHCIKPDASPDLFSFAGAE